MKSPYPDKQTNWLIILLIIFSVAIAYINIYDSQFIKFDDPGYVWKNAHVRSGLTAETIKWAFQTNSQGNWHPLTWLSLAADYSLFGLSPKGFHASSLFIHILSSVVLFLVFKRMTNSMWQSAFVAIVFGVHPLHVESVAWISERKDVLAGLFWVLTMWAYVRYHDSANTKYYYLSIGLFALGLLAKPMLVTLPFVLLLMDYWPLNRIRFGEETPMRGKKKTTVSFIHLIKEKFPFFLLTIISSIITFIVQGQENNIVMDAVIPFKERLANAAVSYVQYLKMTFFPKGLAIFYPHQMKELNIVMIVVSVVILVTVSVVAWKKKEKHPFLFVGWCWFLGTLVPVIGVVQVGMQAMADRYMYIPLIGISIMIAWGAKELLKDSVHNRMIFKIAFVAVTIAMMGCTYMQVGKWKDNKTLFEHTLAVTSDNYLAHHNIGTELLDEEKLDEAIQHFREVIRIMPTYSATYNNLGVALAKSGKLNEAETIWIKAIEIEPSRADVYSNLGHLYQTQGNASKAMQNFETALRLDPNFVDAHYNYGSLLAKMGRLQDAKFHLSEAVRLAPGFQPARVALQQLK